MTGVVELVSNSRVVRPDSLVHVEHQHLTDAILESFGLIPDSGGAGKFRGGLSVRRDFEFPYADCTFTILSDGRKFPPWGLAGGQPGACARFVLDPEGKAEDLPSKITLTVPKGGRVSVQTPGGGGFGNPLLRDKSAVTDDLRNGYVSAASARDNYGFET